MYNPGDRETDRQTDRDRDRDREIESDKGRETETDRNKKTERERDASVLYSPALVITPPFSRPALPTLFPVVRRLFQLFPALFRRFSRRLRRNDYCFLLFPVIKYSEKRAPLFSFSSGISASHIHSWSQDFFPLLLKFGN